MPKTPQDSVSSKQSSNNMKLLETKWLRPKVLKSIEKASQEHFHRIKHPRLSKSTRSRLLEWSQDAESRKRVSKWLTLGNPEGKKTLQDPKISQEENTKPGQRALLWNSCLSWSSTESTFPIQKDRATQVLSKTRQGTWSSSRTTTTRSSSFAIKRLDTLKKS